MEQNATGVRSVPKLIATVLGIGYLGRGGGTVAAAVMAMLWASTGLQELSPAAQLAGIATLFLLGGIAAGHTEQGWGNDSALVVVDEFAGMALALLLLPPGWPVILGAFLFFRLFDITKPLGIRRLERLPGGWGVMGDDLLAGLYANIAMQLVVRTNAWSWV